MSVMTRSEGTGSPALLTDHYELTMLQPGDRPLQVAMVTKGERVPGQTLDQSREHLRSVLKTLPWERLALSRGEPALATRYVEAG